MYKKEKPMYYELRLFSKSEKHPHGYCFQVAQYSSPIKGLDEFGKAVELAEKNHKTFDAAKMPKLSRPFAQNIQLVRFHDTAGWLDEVATWEYQQS
jgi:hypothetical protein